MRGACPFSAHEMSAPILSPSRCSPGVERAGLQRPEGEAGRLLPLLPLFPQVRGAWPAPPPRGCPWGSDRAVPHPQCLSHGETGVGAAGHLCDRGRLRAWRVGCSWERTGTQASGKPPWLRAGGRQSWGEPRFLTVLFPSCSGVIGSGLCVFSRFPILDTLLYQYSLNGYPYMVSGARGTRHGSAWPHGA